MTEFLNNWIYTTGVTGEYHNLDISTLPISWNDPVGGNSHSNFPALGISDIPYMNSIGWYKVLENTVSPTPYETITLSNRTFDNETLEFTDTYITEYANIEYIRDQKLDEVTNAKMNAIEEHFDYLTDTEKFHSIYKSIGLLIKSFAEVNPQTYVNSNQYLQAVLLKVDAMDLDVSSYNSRIAQIKIETDLQTLIAI